MASLALLADPCIPLEFEVVVVASVSWVVVASIPFCSFVLLALVSIVLWVQVVACVVAFVVLVYFDSFLADKIGESS